MRTNWRTKLNQVARRSGSWRERERERPPFFAESGKVPASLPGQQFSNGFTRLQQVGSEDGCWLQLCSSRRSNFKSASTQDSMGQSQAGSARFETAQTDSLHLICLQTVAADCKLLFHLLLSQILKPSCPNEPTATRDNSFSRVWPSPPPIRTSEIRSWRDLGPFSDRRSPYVSSREMRLARHRA